MDIEEIYCLKHDLDKDIGILVNAFSTITGMTIVGINVEHTYTLSSNKAKNTFINTKIIYEE